MDGRWRNDGTGRRISGSIAHRQVTYRVSIWFLDYMLNFCACIVWWLMELSPFKEFCSIRRCSNGSALCWAIAAVHQHFIQLLRTFPCPYWPVKWRMWSWVLWGAEPTLALILWSHWPTKHANWPEWHTGNWSPGKRCANWSKCIHSSQHWAQGMRTNSAKGWYNL